MCRIPFASRDSNSTSAGGPRAGRGAGKRGGGRSGTGAVDDNGRLCAFIYRNIAAITQICPTMDTHQAMQIFHAVSLVNDRGDHPAPYTVVTGEDVRTEAWNANPAVAPGLRIDAAYGRGQAPHGALEHSFADLTAPFTGERQTTLGGIGHA